MFSHQSTASRAPILIFLFSFFCCLGMVPGAQAQQGGTISGKVQTMDGKPAEFVNVYLKGLPRGAVVNGQGHYRIANIQPGTYTLTASLTGLTTQTREVTVVAGQQQQVDLVLKENNRELQEVVISGGQANKYIRQQSNDVAKLPLKNLENPQVYSTVTADLMKDQQNVNISQALTNVAGAVPSKDPAGGTSITLRGFTAEPAARNGLQFIAAGRSGLDLTNVDHFEVLKGPSAVLFGNVVSSYGGAVNIVTKKPFETCRGEVASSVGSYGLGRVTADLNTPLNKSKTLLLRTNAAVNREGSFLDQGHNNTWSVDPSLVYKASKRLTLSLDVEAYSEDLTRTPFLQFGALKVNNVNKIPLPYRSALFDNSLNALTNTLRAYFQAEYRYNDHWTSQLNVSYNHERVDHSYQYYPSFLDATHVIREVALFGPINTNNIDFQHNLRGDFRIGRVRNRLVWGLDYIASKTSFLYNSIGIDTIDLTKPYSPVTRTQVDGLLYSHPARSYPNSWNQYASYLSDLVNITDNLMVMAGGRVDHYTLKGDGGYDQTSFTPKLGIVYQPVKERLSVFGNYQQGFTNQGPAVQPDGSRLVLKPEFAKQWEAGVKLSILQNLLTASASYYNIDVDNSVRYTPDNFTHQDGKQQSKGVELSLAANPLAGLNVNAGYVYNKNQYTLAASGVGKDQTGTPRNVANAWVSYKFQSGSILEGFGFGAGANYVQKSYYNLDNTITIPAYTLVNAAVFLDRARYRLGFAVNNLTNQQYWSPSFTANPQQLRQVVGSVAVKF